MWLSRDVFRTVISNTPLVSIDLIIKNQDERILLGKRINQPAQGKWFVPGGRILKNETLIHAFERITNNELGVPVSYSKAKWLGVFEHFYLNSIFSKESSNISTHYVVLAYEVYQNQAEILDIPLIQHSELNWFSAHDLIEDDDVHANTKAYFL